MYLQYFGLRENPFSIPPDPQYLYLSRSHQEALAHLQYGLGESGGFVQLTGEVGTGKTLLIRALVERQPDDVDVAMILYPVLTVTDFIAAICDELRVPHPGDRASLKQLIDALNAHLLQTHARGRRTVLIIDEAQNLSREVLEQIRLLTNLETTKQKLLKIILIGQPELASLLGQQDLRQLAQRITARYHLVALTRREAYDYIVHRCRVAGAKAILFNRKAMERVYALSSGLPRLINIICDRALLGAYVREKAAVDGAIIRHAAVEAGIGNIARFRKVFRYVAPSLAMTILVIVAVWQMPALIKLFMHDDMVAVASESSQSAEENIPLTTVDLAAVESSPVSKPMTNDPQPVVPGQIAEAKHAAPLEYLLASTEVATDTDSAMRGLFARWGLDYDAYPGATGCEKALKAGLHCIYQSGTWNNLRDYNRPAVIELQSGADRKHHVLVASMTADSVSLEMSGQQRAFDVGEVGRFWFGKYLLFWKPSAPGDKTLRLGDRGDSVRWLRDALARYRGEPLDPSSSELFDRELDLQLRDFQRRQHLAVDGVAGRITLMQLQTYLPSKNSPRLVTASAAVAAP